MRMEVAYALLGDITGVLRLRTVIRVPHSIAASVAANDEIVAILQCHLNDCTISQILKRSDATSTPNKTSLLGRVFGTDERSQDAIVILDPFPVEVSKPLYQQLESTPGTTKIVVVTYHQDGAALVFGNLRLAGEVKRDPIEWK